MNIARSIRRFGLPFRPVGAEDGYLYLTHTPLYLYILTAFTYIFGENILFLRLTTVGFSIGSISLVYLIVRGSKNKTSASVATLLLAINPFWALYSFYIYMEIPMCFFALLSIYFLLKKEETKKEGYYIGVGGAVALSVLVKEFAILFWFALTIYVVLFASKWREKIVGLIAITLPMVISFLGWMIWGYLLNPASFQGSMMRWFGSAVGGQNYGGDRSGIMLADWAMTVSGDVLTWGMLLLLMVSILLAFLFQTKRPNIFYLPLVYVGSALFLSFVIDLKEPRHIILVIPMMAMLIGLIAPWEETFRWIGENWFRKGLALLLSGIFIWQISPLQIPSQIDSWQTFESWWQPRIARRMFFEDRYYGILKEAGEFLADRVPPGEVITIVHEGPVFSYYAEHPYQLLYTRSYESVLETIDKATYLVFDYPTFPKLTPEEIDRVERYIEDDFDEMSVLADDHRQLTVYKRRE